MKAQLEKLYSLLKNDNALKALLGGTSTDSGIYPVTNKQLERFPCITYVEDNQGFNTVPRNTLNLSVEFNIYAKDGITGQNSKLVAENIAIEVNRILNYYKDTDNTIVYVRESGGADLPEPDRQLYRKLVIYQVWARKV